MRQWLELLAAYNSTLEDRKCSANGNVDFRSRLPWPPTERDRSGSSRLTQSDDKRVSLLRSRGLLLSGPSAMRVGLGGLTASDPSSGSGGLPLSFREYCLHELRMTVDDLDAPPQ